MEKDGIIKLGALVAAGAALAGCSGQKAPARPNIVFILADDLGYGDVGCYGQQYIETPNIDALARRGMLFTQAYSGTAVSAPSRCCLITGTHTGHSWVRGNHKVPPEGQLPLPEGASTIFHDFQDAGYMTGAFGKWGLGPIGSTGDPLQQGVDRFYGYNCQTLAHSYYPDHLWDNDDKVILEDNVDEIPYGQGTYSADLIHRKSLEFLEDAVAQGKPFFMWYPTTIPHAELIVPEDDLIQKYRGKFPEEPFAGVDQGMPRFRTGGYCSQEYPHATFAAMVSRLDRYVGEIIDKLKELGVYDNTIVIFTSDNGPHKEGGADPEFFDSNGPLRGIKRDLYEGGMREPFIVQWPGHVPAGIKTDLVCTFWDMMPTFRTLMGSERGTDGLDGIDLTPVLDGRPKEQKQHDFIYFELAESKAQAVRKGPWKLLHLGIGTDEERYELYNLEADLGEENDISELHSAKVAELKAIMEREHVANHTFPLLPGE